MNFDFFNQFIEHPRGQLPGPRIFADGRDEHIRRDGLAFGALHSVLQGFYFFPQLLLLHLILGRHPGKPLVGDLARHIVLIEPLKQAVQLFVAVDGGIQFPVHGAHLVRSGFLGKAHHQFGELLFILADELRQAPDFRQNDLFQEIGPDVMGRGTGSTVALVVGAVEVGDFWIPLIKVEMQIVSAVGADQQAGKHMFLTLMGPALADFPALFLDLLPCGPLDNWLMDIQEDGPILTVILQPPLILVRLGVGLEV